MIEYERKFEVPSKAWASHKLSSLPTVTQVDLFPFGIFKNGFMFRFRHERESFCPGSLFSTDPGSFLITIKWWNSRKQREEREFSLPYQVGVVLSMIWKDKLSVVKTRCRLEDGIFLDHVDSLGYFIEMEKLADPKEIATPEQRAAIDAEFKAAFERIYGTPGEFCDFSYSQRLHIC